MKKFINVIIIIILLSFTSICSVLAQQYDANYYQLATNFKEGYGVVLNLDSALYYYDLSAIQGNSNAINRINEIKSMQKDAKVCAKSICDFHFGNTTNENTHKVFNSMMDKYPMNAHSSIRYNFLLCLLSEELDFAMNKKKYGIAIDCLVENLYIWDNYGDDYTPPPIGVLNKFIYICSVYMINIKWTNDVARDIYLENKLKGVEITLHEFENKYRKEFDNNQQIQDSVEYVTYNQELDSILNYYNLQLLQNQYNADKVVITDKFQIDKEYLGNKELLEKNLDIKSNLIKDKFEKLNGDFERTLKSRNPMEFCKIFYFQNPDKKNSADKLYLECKCQYANREQFDIQFINNNLDVCNCRIKEYQKNGYLFANKAEFDTYFDKGEEIYTIEFENRQIFTFIQNNKIFIETMNFQQNKSESVDLALGEESLSETKNTDINQLGYSNGNITRKQVLLLINNIKGKTNIPTSRAKLLVLLSINSIMGTAYYPRIIDFVIETNKKINKEYEKNGKYFENKMKFYESFISESYKETLNDKRKR